MPWNTQKAAIAINHAPTMMGRAKHSLVPRRSVGEKLVQLACACAQFPNIPYFIEIFTRMPMQVALGVPFPQTECLGTRLSQTYILAHSYNLFLSHLRNITYYVFTLQLRPAADS